MTVTATLLYPADQEMASNTERRYRERYQCELSSPTLTSVDIRNALPQLGDALTEDPAAVVTSYGAIKRTGFDRGHLTEAHADVIYSTLPPGDFGGGTLTQPPWERPARISGGGTEERIFVGGEKDNDNRVIANSAGYPFPDLQVPNSHPILYIEQEYSDDQFNFGTLWSATYAVNVSPWFGLLQRSWRLKPPRYRRLGVGTAAPYWTVFYEFEANFRGWDLRPFDEGVFDKNGNAFKVFDRVYTTPQPLDGNGNFAAEAGPAAEYVHFDGLGGNPQPFKWHPEVNFQTELALRI